MRKIIVDTNILFSALHTPGGKAFTELTENVDDMFYCPNYLIVEIFNHKERLLAKSKADKNKVLDYLTSILNKLHFYNESLISIENFFDAWHLC